MNIIGSYIGLILLFLFLLFIGISAIVEGIKGIRGKKMELKLKDNYNPGNIHDVSKGRAVFFWGIIYIFFGIVFIGIAGLITFLIFNAQR